MKTDKVVIITGASRGIGRATALLFAKNGYSIVITARDAVSLSEVAEEARSFEAKVLCVAGDITESACRDQIVNETINIFGRIDVLINNAGGGSPLRGALEIDYNSWRQTFSLNLESAFLITQKVLPYMQKARRGRIVNVSSLAGRDRSILAGPDYAAAKAGMISLTRQLAYEFGPYGICVNSVAPGVTASERVEAKWNMRSDAERNEILETIPLRRIAQLEEIAKPILFLASDMASYITGATLDVNGGAYMN